MEARLSLDEASLSNGESFAILTNKAGKGQKRTLVAIIEGTESVRVIDVINRIPETDRKLVEEVTLDMAGSMNKIVKKCFPNASLFIDRFHVQKLAYDALRQMRIPHRWDAINEETNAMENAKLNNEKYIAPTFSNGDTRKQLLARSRYLLFKSGEKWNQKQKARAEILFDQYPDIKKAFSLTHSLRMIYSHTKVKGVAYAKLVKWFNDVTESEFKSFNTISATIYEHYPNILTKRGNQYPVLSVQTIKYLCLTIGFPQQYEMIPFLFME